MSPIIPAVIVQPGVVVGDVHFAAGDKELAALHLAVADQCVFVEGSGQLGTQRQQAGANVDDVQTQQGKRSLLEGGFPGWIGGGIGGTTPRYRGQWRGRAAAAWLSGCSPSPNRPGCGRDRFRACRCCRRWQHQDTAQAIYRNGAVGPSQSLRMSPGRAGPGYGGILKFAQGVRAELETLTRSIAIFEVEDDVLTAPALQSLRQKVCERCIKSSATGDPLRRR